jgi:NAD(P)-dependent dehydrogenase (short-subunit alcohol dehydrogenase family)
VNAVESMGTGGDVGNGKFAAPRHAVVTGAGSGIGAAIAQALADNGFVLTLLGRREEALQAVRATLTSADAHGVTAADITDEAALQRALAQAVEQRGPALVLVNNAGQAASQPFLKTDAAHWRTQLDVNLMGAVHATQALLPGMLAAGWGRVVNVASTAALTGYAYVTAYCAAKHALLGFTRALALEVATKGITVNAVCPGFTDTPLLDGAVDNIVAKTGSSADSARATLARRNPQGRLVQPREVADTVRWLCGDGSAAIHGQAIAVAGGEIL